jgi:hypothetical protein
VVEVKPFSRIQVEEVSGKHPLWVVAFHRLARLGKADAVLPPIHNGHTLVRFCLENHNMSHFIPLADAEKAWLIYRR